MNDRNFQPMDEVVLQEWDPCASEDEQYTGREIEGWINYVTDFNQAGNYVVFSFEETGRTEG